MWRSCLTAELTACGRGFDPHIVHWTKTRFFGGTIGAAGSALVLCTDGPGFNPPVLPPASRVGLVGQDSWLSPGRHGFDSRTR